MFEPISHLNTRLKLFEKVSLLLIVMVLLAGANLAVIYTYHQQAEQVGNSVNIAGQQRMLSQRMVWLATDIARGENTEVARDRLRVAIDRYDRNLEALTDGGTVTDSQLNPNAETDEAIPRVILQGERLAPAPPPTRDELASERAIWNEYEPHIRTVATGDPDSAAFERSLEYIRTNNDELLAASDDATAEFARVIRERRSLLETALIVLFFVDIGVAAAGTLLARQYLGLPMAAIARTGRRLAMGETDIEPAAEIPIDRSLPEHNQRAELAQLSRSFEAVRDYHRTVSEQARALAERDFDAPVLGETVPGPLGASLETMQDDLKAYIHELKETTETLDAVIQASPAGILITDPQGRVQRWNPAAKDIFGWDAAEVEGRRNPAVPEVDFENYREQLSAAIVDGPVTGIEGQWQTREGDTIDVSISLAAVSRATGELSGVMAVVEDITERKERERTLRQQRDELAMFNRVNDLLLEITQELVGSSSRERIEDMVCLSLAESDLFDAAWIGDRQAGGQGIRVRTASGTTGVEGVLEPDPDDPIGDALDAAIESGELQVLTVPMAARPVLDILSDSDVGEVGTDGTETATEAEEAETTVVIVPLIYRGTVYGVLVVSTSREYTYRAPERSGLRTLGQTIGFAINAITNRKLLFADTVVDLEFRVDGTDLPLVLTTDDLDCTATLDGFVLGTESEGVKLYLDVSRVTASEFVAAVVSEPAVTDAGVIAEEAGHHRVEVTVGADSILARLSHYEANIGALELEGGTGALRIEAPLAADITEIVELVRSADDAVEFLAKTERERPVTTGAETATAVQERLTDRQYEVFKTAYLGGYFEWPRDSTIEELAENMGIAGSTFHHHLRHAQRKLASVLFDLDATDAGGIGG